MNLVSHSPTSEVLRRASSAISADGSEAGRGSFWWNSQYWRTCGGWAREREGGQIWVGMRWYRRVRGRGGGGLTFLRTLLVTLGSGMGALTSPISIVIPGFHMGTRYRQRNPRDEYIKYDRRTTRVREREDQVESAPFILLAKKGHTRTIVLDSPSIMFPINTLRIAISFSTL